MEVEVVGSTVMPARMRETTMATRLVLIHFRFWLVGILHKCDLIKHRLFFTDRISESRVNSHHVIYGGIVCRWDLDIVNSVIMAFLLVFG